MKYKVLKFFRLSHDGTKVIDCHPGGDPIDVPAKLVDGLKNAGYIGEPDLLDQKQPPVTQQPPVTPPVTPPPTPAQQNAPPPPGDDKTDGAFVLPADWRNLHHTRLIILAKTLDPEVKNKGDAVKVLEAKEKGLAAAGKTDGDTGKTDDDAGSKSDGDTGKTDDDAGSKSDGDTGKTGDDDDDI